ncbi:MAG: hypothetical protein JW800_06975 [Candidatus Omnitrophica bacterium]|nr:hypothetical protein [Candidatus Omnitrophota bacterium]
MSKILELLNYNKRKNDNEGADKYIISSDFNSSTKEKLANTYIFNQPVKNGRVKHETGDRLLDRNLENRESRFTKLFPWIIALLAVILLLVNIAYRGKVSVNIQFVGSRADIDNNLEEPPMPVAPHEAPAKISGDTATSTVKSTLIVDGRLNQALVKKLGFYGGALSMSRMTGDGLILFNDGSAEWASVGIDLLQPMDLSNSTLDFFIKGISGTESLELMLRDVNADSYLPQAKHVIFDRNMGRDWQFVSISFNDFKNACDTKKIKHIGLEFGTQTVFNEPGISIQIKNMRIVKNSAINKQ